MGRARGVLVDIQVGYIPGTVPAIDTVAVIDPYPQERVSPARGVKHDPRALPVQHFLYPHVVKIGTESLEEHTAPRATVSELPGELRGLPDSQHLRKGDLCTIRDGRIHGQ